MAKKINSTEISEGLWNYFQNYEYKLKNTYVFNWESDFFAISKPTGYMYETEIKISRGDFKADLKKNEKHFLLKNHKESILTQPTGFNEYFPHITSRNDQGAITYSPGELKSCGVRFVKPGFILPNCFYYCCPRDLIKVEEIPAYAGLLYYENGHVYMIKKAPFLHRNNLMKRKRSVLLDKFYWLSVNSVRDLRFKIREFNYCQKCLTETESFLRRNGINIYTGKKINKEDLQNSHFNFYLTFSQFLVKELKIDKVTVSKLDKIITDYQNPELNHPQLFKPIKKQKICP